VVVERVKVDVVTDGF
jgi:hypothetical protein